MLYMLVAMTEEGDVWRARQDTKSSSKKRTEFRKVPECYRGEQIPVGLNGYPNPHTTISGLAHKFLAKAFDAEAKK